MAVEKELINGIELMLQGKEEGFNILYSYTYNYVFGRAKLIMKDEQDALDLTQETFIYAYRGIQSLENANNIYAWLGGIVYRNGMKMFRKKRDILVNEDGESIFENIESQGIGSSPEGTAEEKATSEVVKDMLEELPELQRAAVMAFYYDNMKIDDIAEVFECSSNTIKSRLNYAKKFLKERIEMHEKKYAYKLLSINPMVIFLAFKALLEGTKYTLSATTAQGVYSAAGAALGLAPTAITIGGASTAGATMTATGVATATASVTGGATTAATAATAATTTAAVTATSAAAATATVAGMTLGTKIVIGIATAVTVGTMAVGGMAISNNGGFDNLFGPGKVEENNDNQNEETDDENEGPGNTDDETTFLPEEETQSLTNPYQISIHGQIVELPCTIDEFFGDEGVLTSYINRETVRGEYWLNDDLYDAVTGAYIGEIFSYHEESSKHNYKDEYVYWVHFERYDIQSSGIEIKLYGGITFDSTLEDLMVHYGEAGKLTTISDSKVVYQSIVQSDDPWENTEYVFYIENGVIDEIFFKHETEESRFMIREEENEDAEDVGGSGDTDASEETDDSENEDTSPDMDASTDTGASEESGNPDQSGGAGDSGDAEDVGDSGNAEEGGETEKIELDLTITGIYKKNDWMLLPEKYYDENGEIVYDGLYNATRKYSVTDVPKANFAEMMEELTWEYKERGYSYVGDENDILLMDESLFEEDSYRYFKIKLTDTEVIEEMRRILIKEYLDSGNELPTGEAFDKLMQRFDNDIESCSILGIEIRWNSSTQTYSYSIFNNCCFGENGIILLSENMRHFATDLIYDEENKVWYMPD